MLDNKKILIFGLSIVTAASVAINYSFAQETQKINNDIFKTISPIELVSKPGDYINNKIKIVATFDKFSTLGLDYKPAMRDSKKYISFLIKRPDISDHTIPLSELKLIIKRDKAEKLIDMESGDKIELTGEVFSSALNDPWVDVDNIKILSSKTKVVSDKKKVNELHNTVK